MIITFPRFVLATKNIKNKMAEMKLSIRGRGGDTVGHRRLDHCSFEWRHSGPKQTVMSRGNGFEQVQRGRGDVRGEESVVNSEQQVYGKAGSLDTFLKTKQRSEGLYLMISTELTE